uniref:Uncharacterized protein n=1 Tax=Acrobeloides nanus TaxID=290746 RepID=A0A914DZG7_9BILA
MVVEFVMIEMKVEEPHGSQLRELYDRIKDLEADDKQPRLTVPAPAQAPIVPRPSATTTTCPSAPKQTSLIYPGAAPLLQTNNPNRKSDQRSVY